MACMNDLMVFLCFMSSDILFHMCGPLCLIVLAAILVLLVFTCGLLLLRVSCVCISLLLVTIPISGLGNMPLLAENINLAKRKLLHFVAKCKAKTYDIKIDVALSMELYNITRRSILMYF